MGLIKHTVGYTKPSDIDFKDLDFKYKIIFNEYNYTYKVSTGLDDWTIMVGEVLKKIIDEINFNVKDSIATLNIYNLSIADFKIAPLTFLNNRMQIKFYYELKDINNNTLRNGNVIEIVKFSAIAHGTFSKSTEIALVRCLFACLISLLKEIERIKT